jgi:cytochrome c oxidase accessory protein FixG
MSELDPSKLTSVDEFGDRLSIIPAEVQGYFHNRRRWVHAILLAVFLLLPWTSINGHQTILLNIADREFALFGVSFQSYDAPLIFFLLGILTLGLAFVTSVWGRVWCGWACPQTVFIEAVFRRIEKWVEGGYIERRALRDAPLSAHKIYKKSLKWILFFLVSSLVAHSFMAYFVGAKHLSEMMQNDPSKNLNYFLLVSFFTALILFDFAWFREQFCVIMCPYGRIQSLLLDKKSLAVVYDVNRGEPRKGKDPNKRGDCVSCNRCVQVCPTGIDIRNGLQMDCIACTACVDACDEIMRKVKKPEGLIRYDTLDGSKINLLRPRSLIYLAMIALLTIILVTTLATRAPVDLTLMRAPGLPYTSIADAQGQPVILNQYKIHFQNQQDGNAKYKIALMDAPVGIILTSAEKEFELKTGEAREIHFFVTAPKEVFANHHGKVLVTLGIFGDANFQIKKELTLLGPQNL